MNFTIVVMVLGSLGFILLGTFLLNNKYIKNIDENDKELYKEAKSMKLSGYTNILIGAIGVTCSIAAFVVGNVSKTIVIIFVACIAILSTLQYILNKKIRK
ncbi:hypothetical protein [Clostridium sp. 1001271B_151109_B4]|uniref:hypothetical protein n=1 Tax=Clostridium sp. 1001271B_151109_B4 TaxID=2787148 RepID=UPI0018AC72E4|nr:hypothetical protein [Clostridium sp. 1001271B_151109_B4]